MGSPLPPLLIASLCLTTNLVSARLVVALMDTLSIPLTRTALSPLPPLLIASLCLTTNLVSARLVVAPQDTLSIPLTRTALSPPLQTVRLCLTTNLVSAPPARLDSCSRRTRPSATPSQLDAPLLTVMLPSSARCVIPLPLTMPLTSRELPLSTTELLTTGSRYAPRLLPQVVAMPEAPARLLPSVS